MKNWEAFVAGVHQYLGDALRPLGKRLKDVEADVAQLKAEAAQRTYCGVHEQGRRYEKHNAVTMNGNLFICVVDKTTQRPGESNDWRLAVRAGRDARN